MNPHETFINIVENQSGFMDNDNYLNDMLKLIVTVTVNVSHIKICSIWLLNQYEKTGKINLRATQSINPEYVKDHSLTLKQGVVGYVVKSKSPLIVENVLNEPRFKEKTMARKIGLVSMLGIPLINSENSVVGVLNCFTTTPHAFNEKEVWKMTSIARQASVMITKTHEIIQTRVIEEELDTRNLLGRARQVLMQRRGMNQDEAEIWFHNYSSQNSKSIKDVAEAVLLI